MSWDWKKAAGAGSNNLEAVSAGNSGIRRSAVGKQVQNRPLGMERTPSITWESGSLGYGLPGNGIELVDDCDHECPFCHGQGLLPSGSICPVCNGRKTVHVEPPSVRCAFCGGQGQMPPRSNLTCWVCKGKGLVPVDPPVQTCPDCHGKGKRPCESLYCHRCRGVGAVPWAAAI